MAQPMVTSLVVGAAAVVGGAVLLHQMLSSSAGKSDCRLNPHPLSRVINLHSFRQMPRHSKRKITGSRVTRISFMKPERRQQRVLQLRKVVSGAT